MGIFLNISSAGLLEILSEVFTYFPLFAFVALLLAGLNIPFSEDVIIISGALVAQADETLILPCLIAIYLGVLCSDLVSYSLGYLVGRGKLRIKAVNNILSHRYVDKLRTNLERHGFLTFIVCRFIPFGVRNTLFMSSGFFGLKFKRFIRYDLVASLISVNTLFWIVFAFGEAAEKQFHVAGVALFAALVFVVSATIIRVIAKQLQKRGVSLMLTKYGLPQVAVFPGIAACAIAALAIFFHFELWTIIVMAILFVALVWMLSFFRDPKRDVVADENVMYSPCDGTVTEVVKDGDVIKVSTFLSIYNVHINRAPCSGVVDRVTYIKGLYRSAHDPDSARVNEANEIEMTSAADPAGKITVRQVSGAVARRIVCKAKAGDTLEQGARFGMIKFGSRTELIVPDGADREVCVKPGDKVKAGLTVLIRYSRGRISDNETHE